MSTFPQGYTLSFTFREALRNLKNLMTNLSVFTHQRIIIVKDNGNFLSYSILIRIRDGIPVAICCSRITRGQYRRISHSTESQQSGDDGSYGRLTKIPPRVHLHL